MKKYIPSVGMLFVFIIYTVCIKFVDVAAIGPEGSSVGFASINGVLSNMFTYNAVCYNISKVLCILALLVVVCFAGLGFVQLIKRKSFAKVDKEIYVLAIFYILVGVMYVAFEKIVINYRPLIMDPDEGLEASYPSSHTMLAVCVFGSAIILLNKYVNNKNLLIIIQAVLLVMLVGTVVTRMISGVHWFTDIVGGLILSMTLLTLFLAGVSAVRKDNNE